MAVKVFYDDIDIANALINRNEAVTRDYFYRKCYPLFKSIYDTYYTDCNSCLEFINEIYLLILTPSRQNGHCQLENYRGESTLTSWLKTVCLFYCYKRFEKKQRVDVCAPDRKPDIPDDRGDRMISNAGSINLDLSRINKDDISKLLLMMPNKRYRSIIQYRYVDGLSNEETAKLLGMSMENYYNKHKLAKEQYEQIVKKEARYE